MFRITHTHTHSLSLSLVLVALQVLATIFYEPSTRTASSFMSAMQRLGGSVISISDVRTVVCLCLCLCGAFDDELLVSYLAHRLQPHCPGFNCLCR